MQGDIQIDQLAAMRMGIDYSFQISIRSFSFRARPLSLVETVKLMQSTMDSLNHLAPGITRSPLLEELTLAKETLVLASTSDVSKNDPQIFPALLDRITPDELLSLYKQYLAGVDRCNPQLEKMDPAKLVELTEQVKKKAKDPASLASMLTELSLLELVSLVPTLLTDD